jgi:hypothetical protein
MTPPHQPSAADVTTTSESGTQSTDGGQGPMAEQPETPAVIRTAATEFGTGLRSRLGADPNICW